MAFSPLRSAAFSLAFLALPLTAQAGDYTMLKVDGDEIKKSEVVKIWEGLFPKGQAPEFDGFKENVKQNVLRGIVSEHLIYKKAAASDVATSKEVQERIEKLKKKIVTQAFLENQTKGAVSEAALKKSYNEQVAKIKGKKEVRARHILVDSEDKAKDILKKLGKGEKFEELAKEHSSDKGTAVAGGDLGYFTEERMVPEFSKAAFAMKKGEVSKAPIKTNFGWHIIKKEDVRDLKAPSFEEVKPGLQQQLQGEALKDYVNDLVDSAKVEYLDANGKALELTRTEDTTK